MRRIRYEVYEHGLVKKAKNKKELLNFLTYRIGINTIWPIIIIPTKKKGEEK